MVLNKIDERLKRLLGLVENWKSSGSVPYIERDIALEELRRLYEELLASPSAVEPVALESVEHVAEVVNETENMIAEPEEVVAPTPAPAPAPEVEDEPVVVATKHEDMGEAFDDALDIAALLGLSGDDTIEEAERVIEQSREQEAVVEESAPIAEESVAEAPAVEEVAEETAVEAKDEKLVAEEPKPAERAANGGLFDIDDIPVRTKRGRKMISLYNDDVMPVSAPAPEPEPEEVVEPVVEVPAPAPMPAPAPTPAPQRLGDVIAKNVTVLGDKMAEEQPTAAFNRITDIRKAIGLNDKFLMIRDLFGGDANLYEDTINHLNEFDDLDECMIFIVENFRWNPDSEGAKLLVSLIERKLS